MGAFILGGCIYDLELRDFSFNEFVHGILHAVSFNCNGFLNIGVWMVFGEGLFGFDDRIERVAVVFQF